MRKTRENVYRPNSSLSQSESCKSFIDTLFSYPAWSTERILTLLFFSSCAFY